MGGLTVICDRCVEHSVEALTTAAPVFKLVPCSSNTPGGLQKVLASVGRLHVAVLSFEAQIKSLQCQIFLRPVDVKAG